MVVFLNVWMKLRYRKKTWRQLDYNEMGVAISIAALDGDSSDTGFESTTK